MVVSDVCHMGVLELYPRIRAEVEEEDQEV
jgi:hypothetical protein